MAVPGQGNFEASTQPGEADVGGDFVWIEDVVTANLDMLFPGVEVVDAYPFRITRDADFDMKDDGASDLLTNIEELIEMRHWGAVVRLELDHGTPDRIRDILMRNLDLTPYQVYLSKEHLGFADLSELCRIDRPELKFAPHIPYVPDVVANRTSIFDVITEAGMLLYHPYDSFMPVVDFDPGSRQRPASTRDQADAVPCRRQLADRRCPEGGATERQAGRGAAGDSGALRRREQHRLGPAA